jgi:hypothetical protein
VPSWRKVTGSMPVRVGLWGGCALSPVPSALALSAFQ